MILLRKHVNFLKSNSKTLDAGGTNQIDAKINKTKKEKIIIDLLILCVYQENLMVFIYIKKLQFP